MAHSHNDFHRSSYNAEFQESAMLNRFGGSLPVEENQNHFLRYVTGNKNENRQTIQQTNIQVRSKDQSVKRYPTETSQLMSYETGFKKMKFNQIQALKELRQEYEILRNLPMQDQVIDHNHAKRNSSSMYSSESQNVSEISESKRSSKKREVSNVQILTLQKKQLELVVGNSMRKIQELLTNQTIYKKTIHELQLQLDSKTNDDKLDAMTKSLRRNELEYMQLNESHKRQIEKYKDLVSSLKDKIQKLESQLIGKGQQLRSAHDQVRKIDDKMRLQRDKYFNTEIENKRLKMQFEIMQKDKNSEINRLSLLLEHKQPPTDDSYARRLEEELRSKEKKNELLIEELQGLRLKMSQYRQKPKQVIIKEINNNNNNDNSETQFRLFEKMLKVVKEESSEQNKMSMNILHSIVSKMQERRQPEYEPSNSNENEELLSQIQRLRMQMIRMKEEKRQQQPIIIGNTDYSQYMNKIKQLQQEIEDGSITKEKLMEQYRILKSSYEYTKDEYDRLNEEYQLLRERLRRSQEFGNSSNQQIRSKFREREYKYEEQIKQLRRNNDQLRFLIDKTKKEADFNANLLIGENRAQINRMRTQFGHLQNQKQLLKNEIQKIKAFYEQKMQQKNDLLEMQEGKEQSIREEYEQSILSYKGNHERQINGLINKMQGTAELNDRYIKLSSRHAQLQRELFELRSSMKRMKTMNDGVDHLWHIKEAQYQNINESLRSLRLG